jgi:GGDEF domain-containing protein
MTAKACASALRTWLAGTLSSFDATAAVLDLTAASVPAFLTRIQEELDRARRFDLRLSLILIDVNAPSETMTELEEALRRELRGSDVTGAMGGSPVAALLTHTDALGLDNVVRRIRQRLADAAERLNVTDLKLGQAAFSPEVRTADALLELALRHAEPVTVH